MKWDIVLLALALALGLLVCFGQQFCQWLFLDEPKIITSVVFKYPDADQQNLTQLIETALEENDSRPPLVAAPWELMWFLLGLRLFIDFMRRTTARARP